MKSVRAFWDAELGWTVEVPFALTRAQAEAVVSWIKKVQGPRIQTMRGDKREQAARALQALSATSLHQRIVAAPMKEFDLIRPR
jgi:hypothetical protein